MKRNVSLGAALMLIVDIFFIVGWATGVLEETSTRHYAGISLFQWLWLNVALAHLLFYLLYRLPKQFSRDVIEGVMIINGLSYLMAIQLLTRKPTELPFRFSILGLFFGLVALATVIAYVYCYRFHRVEGMSETGEAN